MNLKKLEKYFRVNLLGPGPRLMKKEFTVHSPYVKRIYRAAVSQRLRNTDVENCLLEGIGHGLLGGGVQGLEKTKIKLC